MIDEHNLYNIIYDELSEMMDKSLCDAISNQLTKKISSKKDSIFMSTDINSLKLKKTFKKTVENLSSCPNIIIYTDGSAKKNGKPGATSASSLYLKNFIGISEIKIGKRNENIQFEYNKKNKTKSNSDMMISYPCSNIRGEGYAILYALVMLRAQLIEKINIIDDIDKLSDDNFIYPLNSFEFDYLSKIKESNKNEYNVYIKTDSEFWIKMINNYIPKRVKEDKIFEMKNIDLVCYIYFNYQCLKKNNINIMLVHIRGHPEKRKPKSEFNEDDIGNTIADEIATKAVNNSHYNTTIEL